MYSKKQVMKALRLYRKCGSATKTIRTLGYPSRTRLYQWARSGEWKDPRDCPESPPLNKCHLSVEVKVNAVKRCFYDGESVKSVSKELGCSTTSLYNWRDEYLRGNV